MKSKLKKTHKWAFRNRNTENIAAKLWELMIGKYTQEKGDARLYFDIKQ